MNRIGIWTNHPLLVNLNITLVKFSKINRSVAKEVIKLKQTIKMDIFSTVNFMGSVSPCELFVEF